MWHAGQSGGKGWLRFVFMGLAMSGLLAAPGLGQGQPHELWRQSTSPLYWGVKFSHDGRYLSGKGEWASWRLWDAKSGALVFESTPVIKWVELSPRMTRLAGDDGMIDGTLKLYSFTLGPPPALTYMGGQISDSHFINAVFSRDDRWMVSTNGLFLFGVQVWDVSSQMALVKQFPDLQGHADLSPDGKTIAAISTTYTPQQQDIVLIAFGTWGEILRWRTTGHSGLLMFSPDGTLIATTAPHDNLSGSYKTQLWRAADGQLLRTIESVGTVAFSPDGRVLGVRAADAIRFYRVADGALLERYAIAETPGRPFHISNDGMRFAYTDGQDIVVARYPFIVGDLNCDGEVNFGDINPFVLALTNPAGYQAAFPDCHLFNADINGDTHVDFGDINPFVRLLAGP